MMTNTTMSECFVRCARVRKKVQSEGVCTLGVKVFRDEGGSECVCREHL